MGACCGASVQEENCVSEVHQNFWDRFWMRSDFRAWECQNFPWGACPHTYLLLHVNPTPTPTLAAPLVRYTFSQLTWQRVWSLNAFTYTNLKKSCTSTAANNKCKIQTMSTSANDVIINWACNYNNMASLCNNQTMIVMKIIYWSSLAICRSHMYG